MFAKKYFNIGMKQVKKNWNNKTMKNYKVGTGILLSVIVLSKYVPKGNFETMNISGLFICLSVKADVNSEHKVISF